MRILFGSLVFALLGGAGWFYGARFIPMQTTALSLQEDNCTLKKELADSNNQTKGLTDQIKTLTDQVATLKAENIANAQKITKILDLPALPPSVPTGPLPGTDDDGVVTVDPPRPIGNVTVRSGDTFENCLLTKVEPDGLKVTHSRGVAKLLFTDLSPEMQATYHYDPQLATAYINKQMRVNANSDADRSKYEAQQDAAQNPPPLTTTTTTVTRTVSSSTPPPIAPRSSSYSSAFVEYCRNILGSQNALEHYGYHDIHRNNWGSIRDAEYRDNAGHPPSLQAIEQIGAVQNAFLQNHTSLMSDN